MVVEVEEVVVDTLVQGWMVVVDVEVDVEVEVEEVEVE